MNILRLFFVLAIFSCTTAQSENQESYNGFWEGEDGNYIMLEMGKFKFFWPSISKQVLSGKYTVQDDKKTLILNTAKDKMVWEFRVSKMGMFLFLKDLKGEEFAYYKSNREIFEAKLKINASKKIDEKIEEKIN